MSTQVQGVVNLVSHTNLGRTFVILPVQILSLRLMGRRKEVADVSYFPFFTVHEVRVHSGDDELPQVPYECQSPVRRRC